MQSSPPEGELIDSFMEPRKNSRPSKTSVFPAYLSARWKVGWLL